MKMDGKRKKKKSVAGVYYHLNMYIRVSSARRERDEDEEIEL